jgi:DNA-binding beta-propeller fold protein YncE
MSSVRDASFRLGAPLVTALLFLTSAAAAQAAAPPLVLEAKIPLGTIRGRIDHLAIDLNRQRLFVSELGNDTVGVVDLARRRVLRILPGFREPQGVGYEPNTDTVYVANAGDGSVRLLRGEDFAPLGRIDLGGDADNVRIDAAHRRVVVGYGEGGLAIIDAERRATIGDIRLPVHPESFQFTDDGAHAIVNLPDAGRIDFVDLARGVVRSVRTDGLRGNFPMAIDRQANRVLVVFRSPPTLAAFTIPGGRIAARLATCGDADDVFVDAKRRRIYVSCGEGAVDVIQPAGTGYARIARVPTVAGARTSLFVPSLDRLLVAARALPGEPAQIWVFRPAS